MKRIVSISLGSSQRDFQFTTSLLGQHIEVRRVGTNGDVAQAAALVREYDGQVDAIGLGGLIPVFRVGAAHYPHNEALRIATSAQRTPVVDGSGFQATLERWAVQQANRVQPGMFRFRRILLTSGVERYALAQALAQYDGELRFADPLVHIGLPFLPVPKSIKQLELYAATALPILALLPYKVLHPVGLGREGQDTRAEALFRWADIIVGDFAYIRRFAPPNLQGKTIITDDPSLIEIDDLRERGAQTLITMTPALSESHPFVATDLLEAIAVALMESGSHPTEADLLAFIDNVKWQPTVKHLAQEEEKARFAFVIHPLSTRFIAKHPALRWTQYLPQGMVERVAAQMPPLYVSRIRGVRSKATGKEIEGLLFSLGATPRALMKNPPSFAYRRLIRAARMAERMGAKLMGLGAFTSVVGDAGITVAQKSDIGITSGNSLTVAATLEAAKRAVRLMGGPIDKGRAVVIGATGSIGSVCARLIAQAVGDIVLVAPRPERLLALKQQIEQETPNARVVATTRADAYLGDADLIITTTSALTGKVINVDKLKPGAVVCDVARPPDVKEEDAQRRPDILVIESGEILLPGEPDFGFDIGLPPGTAYACLAETALLAMAGKFEDYTLGRNIEMDRVKEMYRLMNEHGLELAGLRSFDRYITEADIAEKRRLADERRLALGLPVSTSVETM
ncbi:MAG: serine carboxypeptidase [Chloroflexi bacterium AL-W]|nr:serine carboxypeptidase [Chloroflexi bacterium AL-N1]NOK64668.1 serine carboxypeptidase [Chloroflexi bacterium AL-N10]NOK75909.1 serine carboxypeptidase [Chloroflexi bacterium AL-N5]NOK80332.1 serine carboxypeptidase [Chloroflexi bacterium AL-W]NOK86845.1 serine carboxypeptidase [Chloroflexi bacterium AL-N15]